VSALAGLLAGAVAGSLLDGGFGASVQGGFVGLIVGFVRTLVFAARAKTPFALVYGSAQASPAAPAGDDARPPV
jgi:hypothetical protein